MEEVQSRISELEQELEEFRASCRPDSKKTRELSESVKQAIQEWNNALNTLRDIRTGMSESAEDKNKAMAQLDRKLEVHPTIADHFNGVDDAYKELLEHQKRRTAFHRNRARGLRMERDRATIELAQINECAEETLETGRNMEIDEAHAIIATLVASKADASHEVERISRQLHDPVVQIDAADTDDEADIKQDTMDIKLRKGRDLQVLLANLSLSIKIFGQSPVRAEAAEKQSVSLKERISEMETQEGVLKARIAELKQLLQECRQNGKTLSDLTKQPSGTQKDDAQGKNGDLPAENDNLVSQLQAEKANLRNVQRTLNELTGQGDRQKEEWEGEKERLKREIERLTTELEDIRNEKDRDNQDYEKEKNELNAQTQSLNTEIDGLKQTITGNEAELTRLRASGTGDPNIGNDVLNAQIQDLNTEIDDLRQTITNSEVEIAALRASDIGKLNTRNDVLNAQVEALRNSVQISLLEMATLRNIPRQEGDLEKQLRDTIARMREEIERLEGRLEECRAETWQQRRERTDKDKPPPPDKPSPKSPTPPLPPPPPKPPRKPPRDRKRKREDPVVTQMREWEKNNEASKYSSTGKRTRRIPKDTTPGTNPKDNQPPPPKPKPKNPPVKKAPPATGPEEFTGKSPLRTK